MASFGPALSTTLNQCESASLLPVLSTKRHGHCCCRDGICSVPVGSVWAAKAAGRCRDCQSAQNLCANPPQLLIHQYLNRLDPEDPLGNLVSIKAYLLTQVQHGIPHHST